MKNTFFLQGETQGVKATVVKISDLFADIKAAQAMDHELLVATMGQNETIMDMVYAALEEGTKFAFTHKSKEVKALVSDTMDSLLEIEVNNLVDVLFKAKSLNQMEKWKLSKPVADVVIDLFYLRKEMADPVKGAERVAAGVAARKAAEVNKSEVQVQSNKKEENVQMVTIKGASVSKDQVVAMMAGAGLVMGEPATTKLGVGTVVGFEATANGTFVLVQIGEEVKKIMSEKVQAGVQEVVAPKAAVAAVDTSVVTDAISKLLASDAPWSDDAKGQVDAAVGTVIPEVSEEEAFNAREDARGAKYQANKEQKNEAATALSQSAAAQAILAQASKLLGGGAAQASKSNTGSEAARRPAAETKTQNNGGNVQVSNKTQDRPAQGVAGAPASTRRPAADAAGKSQASTGRATLRAGTAGVNRRPAAGAAGTAVVRAGLGLKENAPVVNGYKGKAWYTNEENFPNAISGADFEESRKNEALGITHATFWRPETYNARFNRETKAEELAVLEVEMGAVSFEFRLRYSTNPDAKSPWYCNTITFVEGKNGRQGRWHYTIGVQAPKYAVVVDDKGKVRMATETDNKKAIQYVGEGKWNNQRIYGVDLSEEVIAQVMRWAAFGWEAMTATAE